MEEFNILNIPINFVKGDSPVDPGDVTDPVVNSVTGAAGATGDSIFLFIIFGCALLAASVLLFLYRKYFSPNNDKSLFYEDVNSKHIMFSNTKVLTSNGKKKIALIATIFCSTLLVCLAISIFANEGSAFANYSCNNQVVEQTYICADTNCDKSSAKGSRLVVTGVECVVDSTGKKLTFKDGSLTNKSTEPQGINLPCLLLRYKGIDDSDCTWKICVDEKEVFHGKSSEMPENAANTFTEPLILSPGASVPVSVSVEGLSIDKAKTWIGKDVVTLVSQYGDYYKPESKSEYADVSIYDETENEYIIDVVLKDSVIGEKSLYSILSIEKGDYKLESSDYTFDYLDPHVSIRIAIPKNVYKQNKGALIIEPAIADKSDIAEVNLYNSDTEKGEISHPLQLVKKGTTFSISHDLESGTGIETVTFKDGDWSTLSSLTPNNPDQTYGYFVNDAEDGVINDDASFAAIFVDALHVEFRINPDKTEFAKFNDGTTTKSLILPNKTGIKVNKWGETSLCTRYDTPICSFNVEGSIVEQTAYYYSSYTTDDSYIYLVNTITKDNCYVQYEIDSVTAGIQTDGVFIIEGGGVKQQQGLSGTTYTEGCYWELLPWKDSNEVTINGYVNDTLTYTNVFVGDNGDKCLSVKINGYSAPQDGISWFYTENTTVPGTIQFDIQFSSLLKVKYGCLEDGKVPTKSSVSMGGTGYAAVGDTWTVAEDGTLEIKGDVSGKHTYLYPKAGEGFHFDSWVPGKSGTFNKGTVFICVFKSDKSEDEILAIEVDPNCEQMITDANTENFLDLYAEIKNEEQPDENAYSNK